MTRSNTETLLPTGLITELPSGVNTTLPWRYTVPHKLEKRNEEAAGVLYSGCALVEARAILAM